MFHWSDENVAIMTTMMGKGKSSRDVATVLGITRNAVIGKAGRLDIPRNRNKGSKQPRPRVVVSNQTPAKIEQPKFIDRVGIQKARRERDAAGIAPTAVPYRSKSKPIDIATFTDAIRFIDLTDKHCKFPIDDGIGADMLVCGAHRERGSYCTHHADIARGKGTTSERKAVNISRSHR